jgi:hypothetical protein
MLGVGTRMGGVLKRCKGEGLLELRWDRVVFVVEDIGLEVLELISLTTGMGR